ncbi:MAG: S41 family peptidase [Myxococcota bacterium]|nr:S41 family peptidase [Myxococcota bacterium]
MKPITAFLGFVLSLSMLQGCAHVSGHHTPDRNIQLESFDYAWSRIGETYYDPEMNGLDWQATRDELRPRAAAAATNDELAEIIEEMMERIGESHFQIIPLFVYDPPPKPEAFSEDNPTTEGADLPPPTPHLDFRGSLGIKIRLIGKEVVIQEIQADSHAFEKGIRVGWRITSVDDIEILELLDKLEETLDGPRDLEFYGSRQIQGLLEPEQDAPVALGLIDHHGTLNLISVHPKALEGNLQPNAMLPQSLTRFEARILDNTTIGYIRFNEWAPPIVERFTEAIRHFKEGGVRDGVIVDLRGNPGGVAAMSMGVASHFVEKKGESLGLMKDRNTTLNLRIFPRPRSQRWSGPVVLLIDGLSASTSEIFAAGMQDIDEATVIGSTTAGKALASIVEPLPNGDRIQFVIWNLTRTNGQRVEGDGVRPDIEVRPTPEDFLAGVDPVLNTAIQHLQTTDSHATPPAP